MEKINLFTYCIRCHLKSQFIGAGRRRRRVGRPRKRGRGIFSKINDFLKKHRIISTVGKALGSVGVPYAGAIGNAAGVLGYGRRRRVRRRAGGRRRVYRRRRVAGGRRRVYRRRRVAGGRRRRVRRRGGDLKGLVSKVHSFVKDNRLISRGLRHFLPNSNLHKAASALGYGAGRGGSMFSTDQIAAIRF